MTHSRIHWPLAVAALVFACSDGKKATSDEAVNMASICQAECDWHARCPTQPTPWPENCLSECQKEMGGPPLIRSEYVAAFGDCVASLPCEAIDAQGDDRCMEPGLRALYPNLSDLSVLLEDPLYVACRKKYEDCEVSTGSPVFLDDTCTGAFIFVDAAKASLKACLDRDCPDIQQCLCQAFSIAPAACY